MLDFSKVSKRELEELQIFKKTFLWVFLSSILSGLLMVYTIDLLSDWRKSVIVLMLFVLGFVYRHFFDVYLHNYKKFRVIFDKARGK